MRELGLHICINDVWNRMIENSKKHIYTWFYIDGFHVLLDSENTTRFLRKIWKMARKWLGVPTGIMQNTEDLLRDSDTRAIVNNTSMVIMLAAPLMDRQNLAELFHLSQAQLDFITNSEPGHGLIYNGKVTIPFGFDFPTDTEIYKILTTKHDVKDAQFA
jgi:type IV secretory pathway VirB4 component